MKKLNINRTIKGLMLLFVVVVLLWTLSSENSSMYKISTTKNILDEGFTQIIDGQEIELEHISDFQTVEKGETLVVTKVVPELTEDRVLFFFSKDTEVRVSIDGQEIYSFLMDDNFEFLQTPGHKWNTIPMPQDYAGKTLTIELTSNFENRYETTLDEIFLIDDLDILNMVLSNDGFRIVMSILVFIMTITSFVDAHIWKRKEIKRYYFYLGVFYLFTTLWLTSMCTIVNYIVKKPVFSYMMSITMSFLLPVALYELVKVVHREKSKALDSLGCIVWGNFILQMFLQFVSKISLLNLLPLTYFVFAFCATLMVGFIIHHVKTCKGDINFALVSISLICVGAIVEIIVICAFPAKTNLIGIAGILGLLSYLIVNQIYIVNNEAKIDVKNIELEENYNKLQSTTLMRQIKAHFFFNTLNTISALCKFDAQEADRAILILAKYMRTYMEIINKNENIPFTSEIEIVNATLEIEKLRFPDTFVYELDLEFKDFMLPPMTIQPIVENSIVHGLRRWGDQGKITVKTKKVDNFIQIIVADNGVGFDLNNLNKTSSIGLKNLRSRLTIMANGVMKIESEAEKGTKTTITIPFMPVKD